MAATNVLIVDDDEFFRDSLCEFLVDDGAINIVHRCSSYADAKAWCSHGNNMSDVDAIVLDVMLPYNSGAKADQKLGLVILEKLRSEVGFAGPIVVLTNSRDSQDGRDALERGCSGYLCKHAAAEAVPKMVMELKLALTGEVFLVSSDLNLQHLIVPQQRQLNSVGVGTENNVMGMLGHNTAWGEIKKELGYKTTDTGSHLKFERRMSEWDFRTNKGPAQTPGPSAAMVRQVMQNAPKAVLITKIDGSIVFVNRVAEHMFGHNENQIVGKNFNTLFPDVRNNGLGTEAECHITTRSGRKVPLSVATSTFEEDNVGFYIHIFTDLTAVKSTEQRLKTLVSELEQSSTRLEELVKTDPLTGLLNRRGLDSVLGREIALAKRNKTDVIAILIDLDDFKSINDQHGHAAGDLVLKAVANVLQETLRTSDWLGRIGGDEFLVFLPSTELDNGAMIAERIRSSVAKMPIKKNGIILKTTTSIGVARLPYDVQTLEQVLELTKSGLKSSKRKGKNVVSVSTEQATDDHPASATSQNEGWLKAFVGSARKWCDKISNSK